MLMNIRTFGMGLHGCSLCVLVVNADLVKAWHVVSFLLKVWHEFWLGFVQYVGQQLPYDNITELRQRMADIAPHLLRNDSVESPMWLNGEYFKV